jgi:hypothetical protein
MLVSLIKQIFLCFFPPDVERDHIRSAPTIVEREISIKKATPERSHIDIVAAERRSEEVATTFEREYMDRTISIKKPCKDVAIEEQLGKEVLTKLPINSRAVIPPTKSIGFLDDTIQYREKDTNRCKGCNQIFSSDYKRLACQSPNNPSLCIGCKRYR